MRTPAWSLTADGAPIAERIAGRFAGLSLTLTDDARSDSLDAAFDGARWTPPPMGSRLEVALGWEGAPLRPMGVFIHAETTRSIMPAVVRIRAAAADFRKASGLKAPRTRAWHDTTVGAILDAIAGEHGYGSAASEALRAVAIPHLDQTAESDLHLLRRLAKEHGALFKAAGGNLVLLPRGRLRSASGSALPVRDVAMTDLLSAQSRYSERGRYHAVTARTHDLDGAEPVAVTVGDGKPVYEIRETFPTTADARDAAAARLARLSQATATLRAVSISDPALIAGGGLRLRGAGDGFDGLWIVTRVVHRIDQDRGYTCDLEAEAPPA